jgi:hypothetical protein
MNDSIDRLTAAVERIAALLAVSHINQQKHLEAGAKVAVLHRLGFSTGDIASILDVTTNAVAIALHRARKAAPKGKKKAAKT